ncbi:MAG: thioredoxin domain-containing protein [Acidobacteriota bacterium]
MATDGAGTEVGLLDVELSFTYEDANRAINGCCPTENPDLERTVQRTTQLTLSGRPHRRVGLSLVLPHRRTSAPKTPGGDTDKAISRRYGGLGDAILMSDISLLAPDAPARVRGHELALLAGLRLPTGASRPDHEWRAADGTSTPVRDAVLQPGHGTLDPLLGLRWSRRFGKVGMHVAAIHRFSSGRNRWGYQFGEETQLSVGTSLSLGSRTTLGVSAEALHLAHDVDHAREGLRVNTGGDWVRLSTQVDVAFARGFRVGAGLLVPLYRHSNGNVLDSDLIASLSVARRFRIGRGAPKSRGPGAAQSQPSRREVPVVSSGERIALDELAVPGRTTLVQFHADWCMACKAGEEWLQDLMRRKPSLVVKRIDATDEGPVLEQHAIVATPTFLLIGPDGTQLLRTEADLPAIEKTLRRLDR